MTENDRQDTTPSADESWSPIVELRQYTLHPGKRDVLMDLFEANFVEGQELTGMKIIGQFRDLDDDNKFVWLRGFRGMPERAQSLADFYEGPIWQANRNTANGTMVDSDNVFMLRPARPASAFTLAGERPPPGSDDHSERGIVEATLLYLDADADEASTLSFFEAAVAPEVVAAGANVLAYFVTDQRENNYPILPLREGERVFVWFAGYTDRSAYESASEDQLAAGRQRASEALGLQRPPEVLRLAPTPRSLLRGTTSTCEAIPRAAIGRTR
jgi:hypothetical protein